MNRRLISIFILIAYFVILIKVMVFKDMPTIKIGQLMFNFAGTDAGHAPNFIPLKTILPYLLGQKGWIIAGINLIGNIALLVPVGFLFPLVCRNMTWKKSLLLAIASGLVIEVMQVVLRVGIFDIDDVILNALGVMIGYGAFVILAKWAHSKNYKNIIIAAIIAIAAAVTAFCAIYPWGQPLVNSRVGSDGVQSESLDNEEGEFPQGSDPCGGTGGIGQIVTVGNNTFTIKRKDNIIQIVNLTDQTTIRNSAGFASQSNLKTGDRVTLVGDPNSDGSFNANAVVICNASISESQSRQ